MTLEVLVGLLAIALLADAWRWHAKLFRSLSDRRRTPDLARHPDVTVIRPIKGLDVGLRENIRAGLEMSYGGSVETLFVLDDPGEPSFPILKEEIGRFCSRNEGARARVLFCGEPPPGRTGKLHAMIAAMARTDSEIVAFLDSDLRPEPETLERLVAELMSDSGLGSTFGQVIVTEPCRSGGDVGYALLLNALYTPAVYWVAPATNFEFPFIMGQMMVLRRSAIEAMGGLERVQGHLVDDMRIGQLLHEVGYRNRLAPVRLPLIHYGLGPRGFWKLFVRWISFSRKGLPGHSFKMISWRRGIAFWLGLLLSAVSWAAGAPIAAALAFAVPVSIAVSMNSLHHRLGGARLRWSQTWIGFALVVVAPIVYASIFLRREVTWRGRDYRLDVSGKLAEAPEGVVLSVSDSSERRRTWMYLPPERERRRAA